MNPNAVSSYTILNFALECMKRGAKVSSPLGTDCPYNLIVDVQGKLYRVLVKASSEIKASGRYQVNTWKRVASVGSEANLTSKAVPFDQDDFDLIVGAFYGHWCFLTDLPSLPATMSFHPHNSEIGIKHRDSLDNWAAIGLPSSPVGG